MWELEVGVKVVANSCQSMEFIGVPFTVGHSKKACKVASQTHAAVKEKNTKQKKTFVQVYLMKSKCYLYKHIVAVTIILQTLS